MQTTNKHIAIETVKNVGKHFLNQFRKTDIPQTPDSLIKALSDIETECLEILKDHIDPIFGNIPWAKDDEFDKYSQKAPASYESYWLCDTMDGAIQYLQHIPGWTINLVLIEQGEPVFSVIYDPLNDECFHAEQNKGAYLNDSRISPSKKKSPLNMVAVLEYGHQLQYSDNWKKDFSTSLIHLTENFGIVRNYGPHGLQLAYIGAGRIDLFVQRDLDTHNWLAGILIAQEADAKMLSADGENWKWGHESLIAGTQSALDVYFQTPKNTSCISQ